MTRFEIDSPLPLLTDTARTTIAGPGEAYLSISGQHKTNIFHVFQNAEVTISGLALVDGKEALGGAISNAGSLNLVQCSLSDNVASFGRGSTGSGGAIYNSGSVDLRDCNLTLNKAQQHGGAIENSSDGSVVMSGCLISQNKVEDQSGAGIFNTLGKVEATQCDFKNNDAYNHGGTIYRAFGLVTLDACSVANNKGEDGGGIYNNTHSTLIVVNSVLQDNTATGGFHLARGAGLANWGNATLNNCTITKNIADNSGGGIYQRNGTIEMNYCTISNNEGSDGAGICNSSGIVILRSDLITLNKASANGGGLWTFGGRSEGTNTRIIGNSSARLHDNLDGTLHGEGNEVG